MSVIFFDFFGVLYCDGVVNKLLLAYIHQELRGRYRIGSITSTYDITRYVAQQSLGDFESIIVSSDVGLYKPDPAIFRLACEQFAVSPNVALMIDDIPENCEGARTIGMRAILYTDFANMRRTLEQMLVQ